MTRVYLTLVLASLVFGHPNLWRDEAEEIVPSPGPPEILSEGDLREELLSEGDLDDFSLSDVELKEDDNTTQEENLSMLETTLQTLPTLEITAIVSRSPNIPEDKKEEEDDLNRFDVLDPFNISNIEVIRVAVKTDNVQVLSLSWWQIILVVFSCLLLICLCCHLTGCCHFIVDCCSDSYWGCCSCLRPLVPRLKPPPNVSHRIRRKNTHLDMSCSLIESSTAPRTNPMRNVETKEQSTESVPASLGVLHVSSDTSGTQDKSTMQSVKSIRNYKRTPQSPAKEVKEEGVSEGLPHVYRESSGSYFSWLHILGRSSKRYNVSPSKTYSSLSNKNNNNNNLYRQNTRYRHIADNSRNSAVIPTKISKRSSTASSYAVRPFVTKYSRSAETLDSLDDRHEPLLTELSKSERNIPRSRLSANLAQLEAGRSERTLVGSTTRNRRISGRSTPVSCPTAPTPNLSQCNLISIEKELLKSKETSL